MQEFIIDGNNLTLEMVQQVASQKASIRIPAEAREK
jgi:histidine ammonia-lyase